MIEITDRRSKLEPAFKECLELVSRSQLPAEATAIYKVIDQRFSNLRFEHEDLINYADGYCGNYGGGLTIWQMAE